MKQGHSVELGGLMWRRLESKNGYIRKDTDIVLYKTDNGCLNADV